VILHLATKMYLNGTTSSKFMTSYLYKRWRPYNRKSHVAQSCYSVIGGKAIWSKPKFDLP